MNKKPNMAERVKLLKAMEYIARQINDENVFYAWLYAGIADGDVDYGDLSYTPEKDDALFDFYVKDDEFRDMMTLFLRCMKRAYKSGGLYCDNVVSDTVEGR